MERARAWTAATKDRTRAGRAYESDEMPSIGGGTRTSLFAFLQGSAPFRPSRRTPRQRRDPREIALRRRESYKSSLRDEHEQLVRRRRVPLSISNQHRSKEAHRPAMPTPNNARIAARFCPALTPRGAHLAPLRSFEPRRRRIVGLRTRAPA